MKQLIELHKRVPPSILVTSAFASYVVIFASYHNQMGTGLASLATIPVIVAGWYFGIVGGLVIGALSIIASAFLQAMAGHPASVLLSDPGNIVRVIALTLIAIVTGSLSTLTRERMETIHRLEKYEKD